MPHDPNNRIVPKGTLIICTVESCNLSDQGGDFIEREYQIDHASKEGREKLEKHIWWAMRNNREVIIRPVWEK